MNPTQKKIDYIEKFRLSGKVALVLGGTGLIGSQISIAMAQAGAKTIVMDINEKKGHFIVEDIRSEGNMCEFIKCNLTKTESVKEQLNEIMEKERKIDIIVNTFYPRTDDWGDSIKEMKPDSWSKNVEMHMNSYCLISAFAADLMHENGIRGTIINIGSIYGIVAPDFFVYEGTKMTNPPAYSAIKAGITHFTRYIASYYGQYGIRANIICPGGVYDNQNSQFVNNYNKATPLRRMGRPEEIASVSVFLASEASSYITGATIMVDGGWTCK